MIKKILVNEQMTVAELKDLLLQGNELASDLLYELTRADNRKIWDYVGIEDIEFYMRDAEFDTLTTNEVFDYMKDNYELLDTDTEVENACITLEAEKGE